MEISRNESGLVEGNTIYCGIHISETQTGLVGVIMQTKLHVNIQQGIIDIEGDKSFVENIYSDFRSIIIEKLSDIEKSLKISEEKKGEEQSSPGDRKKTKQKRSASTARKQATSKTKGTAYTPKQVPDLDVTGLTEFYSKFSTKNNYDKILVFCKFLEDKEISPCTAGQIFTCYRATKEVLPKNLLQACHDTKSKKGYINFESFDSISITSVGENHFNHGLERIEK